jgi:rod shape-determining protein MreC
MISLQSSTGAKRAVFVLLAVLAAALLAFPESRQGPVQVAGRIIVSAVALPLRAVDALNHGIESVWNRYLTLHLVREENLTLRQEIARLKSDNTRLRETAASTDRLRALLDLKERLSYTTIAAQVIGRDPTNWYRSIVINKGRKDGLTTDMGVLTPAGVVGRVVKVYDRLAVVLLIIDRNNAVTGLIQRTRDEGIVEGTDKGLARIKYLPLLSTVKVGDQVVTSGLAGGFPRGLPIGRITKIERREAELFLSAEIEPDSDFSRFDEVLVVMVPRETSGSSAPPFPVRPTPADKRDTGESQ